MIEPTHRCGPFSPRVSPAWARLREATIELALEHGLDGVDAGALCARAEVEPAAFAREFEGVRDCALQVYLANIAEFDRIVFGAVDATEGWPARLRVAAYAAARHVRDRPLSTRFDMLAMLTAGDLAQAHRDRYVRRLIGLIDEGRQQLDDPAALGPATAEGVFGSIYQLLARELVGEGGTGRAEELVPQLMYVAVRPYLGDAAAREELTLPPPPERDPRWDRQRENISAHKGQGGRGAASHLAMLAAVKKQDGGGEDSVGRLSRLPPGRHGLSREFVSQNQRDRIAAGIIAAVAEHGYHEATISAIAAAAGLSRRTFYTYFASKDACFFDTFDRIVAHLREAASAAAEPYEAWPDRVRARLAAVLEIFAANPDLARYVLIAPARAGEEIAARYRQAMDEVLAQVTEGMPPELVAKQPSRTAEHALVGGAAALIVRKVEAGEGARLPDLLPDLLELTLAPYVGRDEAIRLARADS